MTQATGLRLPKDLRAERDALAEQLREAARLGDDLAAAVSAFTEKVERTVILPAVAPDPEAYDASAFIDANDRLGLIDLACAAQLLGPAAYDRIDGWNVGDWRARGERLLGAR